MSTLPFTMHSTSHHVSPQGARTNNPHRAQAPHVSLEKESISKPFCYAYRLEDGKLPYLAELRPVRRSPYPPPNKKLPPLPTEKPQPALKQDMSRSKSFARRERNREVTFSLKNDAETTGSKLKRAFSLSHMKATNNTQHKYRPSNIDLPPVPRMPMTLATLSTPPSDSRVPSLVHSHSSPSSSPEPHVDSFGPGARIPINYSLPRSSWASSIDEDDVHDHIFFREAAHGDYPEVFPKTEMRRDKALAMLGIVDAPLSTPLHTPSISARSSIRQPRKSENAPSIWRPSFEHRAAAQKQEPVAGPTQPQPSFEPRVTAPTQPQPQPQRQAITKEQISSPIITQTPTQEKEVEVSADPVRPPLLRRKTSRFIEHLEANAKLLQNAQVNPAIDLAVEPQQVPVLTITSPSLTSVTSTAPIIAAPRPKRVWTLPDPDAITEVRRSQSMKTPSPNPNTGAWAVVCTAQARPIVAQGHARVISS